MNSTAKTLIPNKEWVIRSNNQKIGSITKSNKGYTFLKNGKAVALKSLSEIDTLFGGIHFETNQNKVKSNTENSIYDFPCSSKPYDPVYDVKRKIPLFAKSSKSKSQYCAGYYIIKFKKGWVKSFCPKLITLERYQFVGPFKLEADMKLVLKQVSNIPNETIEHDPN